MSAQDKYINSLIRLVELQAEKTHKVVRVDFTAPLHKLKLFLQYYPSFNQYVLKLYDISDDKTSSKRNDIIEMLQGISKSQLKSKLMEIYRHASSQEWKYQIYRSTV